jgi:hypothetical protein
MKKARDRFYHQVVEYPSTWDTLPPAQFLRKEIEIIEIRGLWSQHWNKVVSRMDFIVWTERKDYEHTSATELDRPLGRVRQQHRPRGHIETWPIKCDSWRCRRRRVCVGVPPL